MPGVLLFTLFFYPAGKLLYFPAGSVLAAEQAVSYDQKKHCQDHTAYKIRKQHHEKHSERHPEQRESKYSFHSVTSEKSVILFYDFFPDIIPLSLPRNQEYPSRPFPSSSLPSPR